MVCKQHSTWLFLVYDLSILQKMNTVVCVSIIFQLILLTDYSWSLPLCTDLRSPFTPNTSLAFCQYDSHVCCNSTEDFQLQREFQTMNISSPGCASLLKSIICSICDPFSAELYRIESVPRLVPVLCNSTASANPNQSQLVETNFCSMVWDECQNISIVNSPFASKGRDGILPNSSSKLSDVWHSKSAFCNEFGGASYEENVCFDGGPVRFNISENSSPPSGICLEKIDNGSYLNLAAHPDGSNRIFLSNQQGKIWLASVPEEGSGEELGIDESNPFFDLTDEVYSDVEFGLMGIAFHPNYQSNGRFFASFNCDKSKWPECSGRCACNSAVACDPSKLPSDSGAQPCQYHSVVAEYTANGTIFSDASMKLREVRRIFTMGLPFTTQHGGQILFGPKDRYLYFMMGDGGGIGDPYNFSQNKKSLLGKILRLDVDNTPSTQTITDLGLWGNYSIPGDNPFSEDKELQPEIWALGLRNPWRCSFDLERPSYFLCADVGEAQYEEVDIITKGGNYGWRVYEGPFLYNSPNSSGGNASASTIDAIFPAMGYIILMQMQEQDLHQLLVASSIHLVLIHACMEDLYAGAIWTGSENPLGSGNFTSAKISVSCALDSPIECSDESGGSLPALGYIFSFGQDNRKDIFILASSGLYRIVRPSRCNFFCSKQNVTASRSSPPTSAPSPSNGCHHLCISLSELLFCSLWPLFTFW